VARVLRFVAVTDGFEVGRLELLDDDTVRSARENDSQASLLKAYGDFNGLTPLQVFTEFAANGWSNGYTMIRLDDLDRTRVNRTTTSANRSTPSDRTDQPAERGGVPAVAVKRQ
jgi:hypothetical protein